jgi:peptidoglycan/xylan/chitin deacetylase (PgdA/CDA1 family)
MYVSPEALAMHLRVLGQHFEVVGLGEWIGRSRAGRSLPDRACAITFDDGWRDNYTFGFPILKQADVPATIFLVADLVGSNYEFWPNGLARLLVGNGRGGPGALPPSLLELLTRLGVQLPADGSSISVAQVDRVISACKAVPDETMLHVLAGIGTGMGVPGTGADGSRNLLNQSEIEEMGDSRRIRFGSHGRRHLRLIENLTTQKLNEEIVVSREILQRLTGQPVDLFCYPNGDHSPAALEAVRRTYRAAVTTDPGWSGPLTDLHLMPRMSLHEDIAADEQSFLARVGGLA